MPTPKRDRKTVAPAIAPARLREMIEDAIVDAYGEAEQTLGFLSKLQDELRLPFTTMVLGVDVIVSYVDATEANEIVVTCRRGRARQAIPILALPLPHPRPGGWEWIEAYRAWARGGAR
jgi:hypothetical protein